MYMLQRSIKKKVKVTVTATWGLSLLMQVDIGTLSQFISAQYHFVNISLFKCRSLLLQ